MTTEMRRFSLGIGLGTGAVNMVPRAGAAVRLDIADDARSWRHDCDHTLRERVCAGLARSPRPDPWDRNRWQRAEVGTSGRWRLADPHVCFAISKRSPSYLAHFQACAVALK